MKLPIFRRCLVLATLISFERAFVADREKRVRFRVFGFSETKGFLREFAEVDEAHMRSALAAGWRA